MKLVHINRSVCTPSIQCYEQDATKKTHNEKTNMHIKVSVITD